VHRLRSLAKFLNGHTTVDFGRGGREHIGPRVFSFHELEGDPVMTALAYAQVLSAIRRDSLHDEQPRIIAWTRSTADAPSLTSRLPH